MVGSSLELLAFFVSSSELGSSVHTEGHKIKKKRKALLYSNFARLVPKESML